MMLFPTRFANRFCALFGALVVCTAGVAIGRADGLAAKTPVAAPSAEQIEFFETKVRPLLVLRCQKCHSGDDVKGGLTLNSREHLLQGGDSGPAIDEKDPAKSLLLSVIRYDGDIQMPPKGKLPDDERKAIEQWVLSGAAWPQVDKKQLVVTKGGYEITPEQRAYWAFQPVRVIAPPKLTESAWPKNEIDKYILARLEKAGLRPAKPADKRTLLRRATYDLTGLPPTKEELDAFLSDRSPDAFAKVVDRLLASPRYGERWGRHWLDVVRYADSIDSRLLGGPADIVDAYRYRDWVVDALNRDMPYDQFVRKQLAGDLLPYQGTDNDEIDSLVATSVLSIGRWEQGCADKEKMLTDIVDDQVDLVGRGFLGLTLACARCHDHKFDPIPTADYYSLAGIFFSSRVVPDPGPKGGDSPRIKVPLLSAKQLAAREQKMALLAAKKADVAERQRKLRVQLVADQVPKSSRYMQTAWDYAHRNPKLSNVSPTDFAKRRDLNPFLMLRWLAYLGLAEQHLLPTAVQNAYGAAGLVSWRGKDDTPSVIINTNDRDLAILSFSLPARAVAVHPGPNGAVAVTWKSPVDGAVTIAGELVDRDGTCGDGIAWMLSVKRRNERIELAAGEINNGGGQQLTAGRGGEKLNAVEIHSGDLVQLAVLPRGGHYCDTTAVEFSLKEVGGQSHIWRLADDLKSDPSAGNPHADQYGNREIWHFEDQSPQAGLLRQAQPAVGSALDAWFKAMSMPADQGRDDALHAAAQRVRNVTSQPPGSGPDVAWLNELRGETGPFALSQAELPTLLAAAQEKEFAAAEKQVAALESELNQPLNQSLGIREGGVPQSVYEGIRDGRILVRGNYTRPGEIVPRRFPRILAGDNQPPITQGSGRLELANWITQPDHPTTARVIVNRIWQYHFGNGIVRTPSNFGKLGAPPTHPELLDYLADQFVHKKWSIKTLHRQLMLTATYQQSSEASIDDLQKDPDNQLLGRMNRRRLEAEALRDGLLAVSGRLDPRMGGPSDGDLLTPRRTIYQRAIRSNQSPFGSLFDAADPTAIVERRNISTVAPQSLFLLNSPFILQQAAALADKMIEQKDLDEAGHVSWLYERLYSRLPSSQEIEIARHLLVQARATIAADKIVPPVADRNLAAWREYCQVLLCANEFVFVD